MQLQVETTKAAHIDSHEAPEAGEPLELLSGPIVHSGTMLDVVNMLSVAGWTGELSVEAPGATFRITLHRGGLENASSSLDSHRLGELLVAQGAIAREQLAACLGAQRGRLRIGELLVRKGVISRDALFDALRNQAQEIFYCALLTERGRFCFSEPAADAEPPPIAFHLPIQHLVLEGARRIDERVRAQRDALGELVAAFSSVLRLIFGTVEPHGQLEALHEHVRGWIETSRNAPMFGDGLGDDGTIDAAAIARHVCESPSSYPAAVLYQLLHDLTTFALFAAGPTLHWADELRLAREVNTALRAIPVPED